MLKFLMRKVDLPRAFESQFLAKEALFEAALHHTASVLVSSNLVAVSHTGVEDELTIGRKLL